MKKQSTETLLPLIIAGMPEEVTHSLAVELEQRSYTRLWLIHWSVMLAKDSLLLGVISMHYLVVLTELYQEALKCTYQRSQFLAVVLTDVFKLLYLLRITPF